MGQYSLLSRRLCKQGVQAAKISIMKQLKCAATLRQACLQPEHYL